MKTYANQTEIVDLGISCYLIYKIVGRLVHEIQRVNGMLMFVIAAFVSFEVCGCRSEMKRWWCCSGDGVRLWVEREGGKGALVN